MKKSFDCVEMQRQGAKQVRARLEDLSFEQQIDYWKRGTDGLRERQEEQQRNPDRRCLRELVTWAAGVDSTGAPYRPRKKSFDCVEMKRRGAEQTQARLAAMSREEELEFWRKGTEELRERQREMRKQEPARTVEEILRRTGGDDASELEARALVLPREQREHLAHVLLESLNDVAETGT